MLGIAKEMADRFIEFALKYFKGESVENQLTKALKAAVLMLSVLLFVIFSLTITTVNLRMELTDAEVGLSKINMLFDSNGGPINGFIRINDALTIQMNLVKEQNLWLVSKTAAISSENSFLKRHLVNTLEENDILKNNNKALLLMCHK